MLMNCHPKRTQSRFSLAHAVKVNYSHVQALECWPPLAAERGQSQAPAQLQEPAPKLSLPRAVSSFSATVAGIKAASDPTGTDSSHAQQGTSPDPALPADAWCFMHARCKTLKLKQVEKTNSSSFSQHWSYSHWHKLGHLAMINKSRTMNTRTVVAHPAAKPLAHRGSVRDRQLGYGTHSWTALPCRQSEGKGPMTFPGEVTLSLKCFK